MTSESDLHVRLPDAPPPAPKSREAALAEAMRRFDAKHGAVPQGFASSLRLRNETALPPSRRSSFMPRARHLVAASLVALMAGSVAFVQFADRLGAPTAGSKSVDFSKVELSNVEPPDQLRLTEKDKAEIRAAPPVVEADRKLADAAPVIEQQRSQEVAKVAPQERVEPPAAPPKKGADAVAANERKDERARAQIVSRADQPAVNVPKQTAPSQMAAKPVTRDNNIVAGMKSAERRSAGPGLPGRQIAVVPASPDMSVQQPLAAPQGQAGIRGHIVVPEPGVSAEPSGRDKFQGAAENPFKAVRESPVSTFSIDVDTASYSFMRASLNRNVLPQPASVRTEELINYFPYAYEAPTSVEQPFRTSVAVFPSPWQEGRKLVRIGIRGYALETATRPRANLVFLVDTSGSMDAPNRLPLVKQSLSMLVGQLEANDRVAIVAYAGRAGTVLEPTSAADKARILGAIQHLEAGGSTAGAEGIRQAYALAEQNFDKAGVNRVILATDGDFNVGITNRDELKGFIERERGKGIFLSVLGFGMGNYNDALMQALAQNGNGAAAYIDTLAEARKVLVEEATSTLFPIAKDVKIQVEFNPATVAEYRLIGYETRLLNRDDFANDKVDAGDVGSGQTVTALYEIVPVGGPRVLGELRYGDEAAKRVESTPKAGEYAFVNIRYKLPKQDTSTLISTPVDKGVEFARFDEAPVEARFATAVAAFGEILRGGRHTGKFSYDDVLKVASAARGDDPYGYRAEFLQLVRAAKAANAMVSQRP
jgi:Ca-activated chloride channel homolog